MKHKTYTEDIISLAISLREQNISLNKISKIIGCSKGTLNYWFKSLRPDLLGVKACQKISKGIKIGILPIPLKRREKNQQIGRDKVKNGCSDLYKMGCMLYWAEGSKSINQLRFSNSDPNMVLLFKRFLDEEFKLPTDKFRIGIYLHEQNDLIDLESARKFWSNLLDVPLIYFHNVKLVKSSKMSSKKKKNKLAYGVCHILISSTDLLQQIYGSIQEIGNFTNDKWIKNQSLIYGVSALTSDSFV